MQATGYPILDHFQSLGKVFSTVLRHFKESVALVPFGNGLAALPALGKGQHAWRHITGKDIHNNDQRETLQYCAVVPSDGQGD